MLKTPTKITKNQSRLSLSWPPQRMTLCIKHPLIQIHDMRLCKEQVIILERFAQPEAFHLILELGLLFHDVVNGTVGNFGACSADGSFEHFPTFIHPTAVASDAVHVEYGFNGFRSIQTVSILLVINRE